jgi:hypothetical protein
MSAFVVAGPAPQSIRALVRLDGEEQQVAGT